MRCPFCVTDIAEAALVCAACGRDTAIPEALIAERAELLVKRDALMAQLGAATARLAARRKRKSYAEPA